MQLRINGKPYVYTHECPQREHGRLLSYDEMQKFVTKCLIDSFRMKDIQCIEHSPDFNTGADFSFKKLGKTYLGIVKYCPTDNDAKILIDELFSPRFEKLYPNLVKGFNEHGSIPVFYIVTSKYLNSEENKAVAGGDYHLTFHPFAKFYRKMPTKGRNISDYKMYEGYAKSWETGDTKFLEDYVVDYFSGSSDLSFDGIYSKEELIDFIKAQHKKWDFNGIEIKTELVKDTENNLKGILIKLNNRKVAFVTLNFSNYRISNSHTLPATSKYDIWDEKCELSQVHGDHHAPFLTDNELHEFIGTMLQKSLFSIGTTTEIVLDEDRPATAPVASLLYEEDIDADTIKYMALVAYDKEREVNEFVTAYPYLEGKAIKVKILDVIEWDNKIEATIKCRFEHDYAEPDEYFDFYFFATDYFFNKNMYERGAELEIGISATCGKAEIASKGFTFEGQKAIDFLAKIGKEPTYDEKGDVEPVKFSTEKLVTFLPLNDKFPDTAEFQSPAYNINERHYEFYGKTINICDITINKETGLQVPLYFNSDCEPAEEEGIHGILWLSGRISNPGPENTGIYNNLFYYSQIKPSVLALQEVIMQKYQFEDDYKVFDEVFNKLNQIKLKDGYSLRSIKVCNGYSHYHEVFTEPTADKLYGWIKSDNLNSLPKLFDDIIVQETPESVWQAFLLYLLPKLLPRSGVYAFERKYFSIFTVPIQYCSEKMEIVRKYYPQVIYNKKDHYGHVVIYYSEKGKGILREVYNFNITKGVIRFLHDATYQVPTEDNIKFRMA